MVLTVNMMRLGESVAPGGEVSKCDRLHRALSDCHQKIPPGPPRQAACRHLNRSLAECLVSVACPEESDAVRSLCSSSGTALKRHQCQQAQLSLSVCLSSHQSGSNFWNFFNLLPLQFEFTSIRRSWSPLIYVSDFYTFFFTLLLFLIN